MNPSNWKSESIIDRQLSTNKKSMGLIPMSATTSISVDHPLSPLPTTDQSKSNQSINQSISSQQTKSYFDLKAETDLIINLNSDQNIQRPPTPSTSKFINQISNSTQHIQKPIKNDQSDDQSINTQSIVEHDNPNSSEETTTVTNQTESIDKPKRDKKGKCSSNNSSPNSINGKSAEKKSVQINLTNEPHRIKSNRQILRELKTTVNIESLSQPSSSNNNNHIKVENRIMSDLMLTIIRQLSSKLEQTKKELASSQAETQALKSLLVHSYSVGLGEIERCLVRSKVVISNDPSSSSESNQPWTLDIPNNWNRSKDQQQQQQRTSDEEHPTTISINHLSNLDLEDLREAMYDNPSYETASLSSCSRSHTSPTSLIHNQPPSKTINTNSLKSSSRSSSTKPTSARPPPPLLPPPPIKSSTTKLSKKKSTVVPKTSEHHQHNRADSTSSNLSGVSSTQYNTSINSVSGSWGFQGWRWTNKIDHHRTKITTSVADEEGCSGERSRGRNESKGKETDNERLETQDPSQTQALVASKINTNNKLFANLFTRRSTSLNRTESKRRKGGGGEVVDQESKKMNESSTNHNVDQSKQVISNSEPNSIAVKSISVEEEDSTRILTPSNQFYERGQSHASGSSHQLLATPASVESSSNSEFMLKTGSIRSSSCGSAISSSLNSICLPSAAFLPPPTQSSDLMEHLVCNSSNASDTSSLAVSRVLSDLPTQPPTLTTTTDIVPEFVIEPTTAATLLSPALGPTSRKTSITQKSPILLPTPSMSESPFSHSSPPRIHQPQPRESETRNKHVTSNDRIIDPDEPTSAFKIETNSMNSSLLESISRTNNEPSSRTNVKRPGTPAKKSVAQSKLTSNVLTKAYLSTTNSKKHQTCPNVTTVPNTAFNHLPHDKPEPIALPSTMELNTILNTKTNPPPFSVNETTNRETEEQQAPQQPLTDRFGFIVDVKYGMKLMRSSRKKSTNKKGMTTTEEEPNVVIASTALPIKSKSDVEAEINSLKESLGLSFLNEEESDLKVIEEEVKSNESIKRLLAQLLEMQEVLEKSQLIEWNQFINQRRSKMNKKSNHVSNNSNSNLGIIMNDQSVANYLTTKTENNPNKENSNIKLKEEINHDENLIGIASMGLNQETKEDWKKFKSLILKGIPISLRSKIWLECSGANEIKEPGYYDELLEIHKNETGMALNQIECDVTRTLPTNIYFGGDGPGVNKLRRVLTAMSWHNPIVGYCQGMNMVAATLLLTIPNEEDAFWILVCIVEKILPNEFYTTNLLSSQADQRVLKDLVEKHLPELWQHFENLEVELAAITFGWFLSLFADALPIQTLLRVFDIFLIEGPITLFKISLSLLKFNQVEILSNDSPASLYSYMRGSMTLSSHNSDGLINLAFNHLDFNCIKNKEIVILREFYLNQLRDEMGLVNNG